MKFEPVPAGRFVEAVAATTPQALRRDGVLPERIRSCSGADAFLVATSEAANLVADMVRDRPDSTGDATADALRKVAAAARRMQAALAPLADGSEASRALGAALPYLLYRSRERSNSAPGRPSVPVVDTRASTALALLNGIQQDLGALRLACEYTAGRIRPRRSQDKAHERLLVAMLAEAHQQHLLVPLQPRGWFLVFAQEIGLRLQLNVGRRIVVDVIAAMQS